jgi:phosphodiesterase/alkaline phosphatase D-like protein
MMPDRGGSATTEGFEWDNNKYLYQALKENKADNVFLISGDIHMS